MGDRSTDIVQPLGALDCDMSYSLKPFKGVIGD